jgi:hypothetical protein
MQAGRSSRTAEQNALFRALETSRPAAARLFEDRFARTFLTWPLTLVSRMGDVPGLRDLVLQIIDSRWPGVRSSVVARTRLIDDMITACVRDPIKQFVMLGAGFDSRAYRLPVLHDVAVFEVDHPDTQARKCAVLQRELSALPAHVRYVGSLFSRADRTADGHTVEAIEALPRPRLFISLGTTYAGALLPRCLTAARDLDAGLIVSLGVPGGQASGQREIVELTSGARSRCLVRPFFQAVDDVLQRADAVVSVGAGQTVMDALSHGRPLLCLPQQGEQRDIALAIEERGAGHALIGNWVGADLNSAMVDVATNPAYSAAAGLLREESRTAGGATVAAAAVLDALGSSVA